MNKITPKSYRKKQALELWNRLKPVKKLTPEPIVYKHKGTTIAEDGIRICGSEEFILSVMSRLKDLLEYEGPETRIGIAFSQIQDKETKCLIPDAFRCSIQVHERGHEARHCNLAYGMMKNSVLF